MKYFLQCRVILKQGRKRPLDTPEKEREKREREKERERERLRRKHTVMRERKIHKI